MSALSVFYDGHRGFITRADMTGNADSYAIQIQYESTIYDTFNDYYLKGGSAI